MNNYDDALFYTCSLIEYMGRETKNERKIIIDYLGEDLERIYNFADVFHCETIEKVSYDFIKRNNITNGNYDNISKCKYEVPGYWEIGKVFGRLIEDCFENEDIIKGIKEIYHSWLADEIFNFNSDLYYQPRDYLAECYKEGEILQD